MQDTFHRRSRQTTRLLRDGRSRGFALVVTLTLMILLTLIGVGLLTLSGISLRTASRQGHTDIAKANARLALMLAIGELQKSAGDDRRITADGSILQGATHGHAVGVWRSWSPRQIENPTKAAPDYGIQKTSAFMTWLVSGDPVALKSKDWAVAGALNDPVNLCTIAKDGYELAGSRIEVTNGTDSTGRLAWVVSQTATKAKINVGGPEDAELVANDNLQAQPRPSLGLSTAFNNPTGEWNRRANRVISMSQAKLDTDVWKDDAASIQGGANFTAYGFGLLADVVNGGLKTDLSLGFEIPETEFTKDEWSDVANPFRYVNVPSLGTPFAGYKGQRPLYKPLRPSGVVNARLDFTSPAVQFAFPAAAVPTFATLRSFYRTPRYLYSTPDGPAVFERGMDHVSLNQAPPAGLSSPPWATPPARATRTAYRPILDRVLFVLSVGIGTADNRVRLVITPLVTLWNPYNTTLEIEGAVAYPWIDVPFTMDWTFRNGTTGQETRANNTYMSGLLYSPSGRSADPYFYAAITADGQPGATEPIRFQPGEVRVFAPANPNRTNLRETGTIRQRTVFLRPVNDSNQLSARGGFAVEIFNPAVPWLNFNRAMQQSEKVEVVFKSVVGEQYPFFISLEDATRAKGTDPQPANRGQAIGDVQTQNFTLNQFKSPWLSLAQLKVEPQPFGVIETYHRTALDTASGQRSDLVFTANPRQPFNNRYLAQGDFKSGPQYETKVRGISSLNGLLESLDGRGFYGASNSAATGRTHLSFFEVPRAPMLSLAGFQHADLSFSACSTANQFANSWASAYLSRSRTALSTNANDVTGLPVFDHCYLSNEALWDSFFFSGAAPDIQPGSSGGSPAIWDSDVGVARVVRSLEDTLRDFVEDPEESPLRNPRFHLHRGGKSNDDLIADLTSPAGCTKIAAHLMVDGAFNINSTHVEAWATFLAGLRGKSFDVTNGTSPGGDSSTLSRFRNPIGKANDNWQGFRSLSDSEIRTLATKIVDEVRLRGPFQSLGEFVNRRIENSAFGLKGAIQSAIDASDLNKAAMIQTFDTSKYPSAGKINIVPNNTGVGIPGYLTQADVLQSIAPVITPRSDTFTIRAYGESTDMSGKAMAKAWCEAVVQRDPRFVDMVDPPTKSLDEVNSINRIFGRQFSIVSFRYLTPAEVGGS